MVENGRKAHQNENDGVICTTWVVKYRMSVYLQYARRVQITSKRAILPFSERFSVDSQKHIKTVVLDANPSMCFRWQLKRLILKTRLCGQGLIATHQESIITPTLSDNTE